MKRLFFLLVFTAISFAQYDTVLVKSGWNNIGSVQTGMAPQIINTVPPGIITSPYYGYNPGGGYYVEDTLKRGGGYWIKSSQDGLVIFGVAPQAPTLTTPVNGAVNVLLPVTLSWNPVNGAESYTLHISTDDQFTVSVYYAGGLTSTSQEISGLDNLTQYYWRVSATNIMGVSPWSSVWSFTIAPLFICGINQVNYEGKFYNTVQIGSQCWLTENLDVGTMIQGVLNMSDNGMIEKYCYLDNPTNCTTYGALYPWNEAMQYLTTPGTQGICPPGWHIPTYAEFQTLSTTVGGNANSLKAVGQGTGGGAGTNTSGFSALLAGYHEVNGNFTTIGVNTYFWSSTEIDANNARYLSLNNYNSSINFLTATKGHGFSVRCLKD